MKIEESAVRAWLVQFEAEQSGQVHGPSNTDPSPRILLLDGRDRHDEVDELKSNGHFADPPKSINLIWSAANTLQVDHRIYANWYGGSCDVAPDLPHSGSSLFESAPTFPLRSGLRSKAQNVY